MFLDENGFGFFLKQQREKKQIRIEELEKGLYARGTIGKIEDGERYPDKLMRDRLIARMGESGYDYENYLDYKEFEEWVRRQEILDAFDAGEAEQANKLLEKYEAGCGRNKLKQQFALAMRMQYFDFQRGQEEEKRRIISKAVRLTMPNIENETLTQWILSAQEINLLIEYFTYNTSDICREHYAELLQYVENGRFDAESKALLCSKLAYFYCKTRMKHNRESHRKELLEALQICNRGIEALRDNKKIYFAWELLQEKEKLCSELLGGESRLSETEQKRCLKEQEEARNFFEVIDFLYERFQVPKHTNAYTYFYREYEVYCINDVIRARRKMFGIRREELEDICTEKTMRRIEANGSNIQKRLAQRLFKRFGLSGELQRSQVVTEQQEVLWMEKELRVACNRRDFITAEECFIRIKERVSKDEITNKQYLLFIEHYIKRKQGMLSNEQYIECVKDTLELTIPFERATCPIEPIVYSNGRVQVGEKYLTNNEVTLIHNMANGMKIENRIPYRNILHEYYEYLKERNMISSVISMYNLVMTAYANDLGSLGRYMESDEVGKNVLRNELQFRRLNYVERNLYSLWWNQEKNIYQDADKQTVLDRRKVLTMCMIVDAFCKDYKDEKWIKEKLDAMKETKE